MEYFIDILLNPGMASNLALALFSYYVPGYFAIKLFNRYIKVEESSEVWAILISFLIQLSSNSIFNLILPECCFKAMLDNRLFAGLIYTIIGVLIAILLGSILKGNSRWTRLSIILFGGTKESVFMTLGGYDKSVKIKYVIGNFPDTIFYGVTEAIDELEPTKQIAVRVTDTTNFDLKKFQAIDWDSDRLFYCNENTPLFLLNLDEVSLFMFERNVDY